MIRFKYAAALAVAGGAMGAASQTAAAVVTQDFDLTGPVDGSSFSTNITLAGAATPQFVYHGGFEVVDLSFLGGPTIPSVKHHLSGNGSARLNPTAFGTPGLPAAGEDISATSIKTYAVPFFEGGFGPFADAPSSYYHLTFGANGDDYVGAAQFDGTTLKSISYELVGGSGAPEPAAWALMIAGTGMAGAALRRRRQLAA